MKTLKTLCITLLVLMLSGSSFAQMRHAGPKKMDHPKRPRMGMMKQLNLTQDQQKQIKQIRLDLMQQLLPLRNQIAEQRAKLRTLTTGENADFKAAENVVDDMTGLRAQMTKKGLESKEKIRNLLTDEQKLKFDAHPGFAGQKFSHHKKARHHK